MELKPGYKQTEVGAIPEDWDVARLGEIASVTAGGTPSRTKADYWNGDIPWITTSEVEFHIIDEAEQFITKEGLKSSAAKLLPPGTLVMALYGQGKTRGKVGILGIEAASNQACAAISLNRGVSGKFVFHFLGSRYQAIRNLSNTGNQENLNGSLVRSISILLPPHAEQEAIAKALSDADALIESLEQLLAKKSQLKQGALQQLLTGKKRLPGFEIKLGRKRASIGVIPEDWESTTLGSVCSMKSGESITSADIDQFSRYACYGGNGLRGFSTRFTHDGRYALIGRQGALCGNVILVEGRFFASEHAIVATASARTDARWLSLVLGEMRLNRYSESSAQPGLSVSKLLSLELAYPPNTAEQMAIAAVLFDMDAEIAALEAKVAKARALKQGMMQELLTGRIRLV